MYLEHVLKILSTVRGAIMKVDDIIDLSLQRNIVQR